jgi:hypothetical protein
MLVLMKLLLLSILICKGSSICQCSCHFFFISLNRMSFSCQATQHAWHLLHSFCMAFMQQKRSSLNFVIQLVPLSGDFPTEFVSEVPANSLLVLICLVHNFIGYGAHINVSECEHQAAMPQGLRHQ